MKINTRSLMILFSVYSALFSSAALAVDQVTLSSGEVLEGKVLADVPHQHVDIQLLNGTKKRIPRNQVTDVQRDVPSNHDTYMRGTESRGYLGALIGGTYNFDANPKNVRFDIGARTGINAAQLGDSKLAFGLEFNYTSLPSTPSVSVNSFDIMLQMLIRKISNGGFYVGPELGLAFNSVSFSTTPALNETLTTFAVGAVAGYDFYLGDAFSVGPELKLDHHFKASGTNTALPATTAMRFLISGTFHL